MFSCILSQSVAAMQENSCCSFSGFVLYYLKGVRNVIWNLEEAIAYYKTQGAPGDQSSLIALLREIQREKGGISQKDLAVAAEMLGTKTGIMLALIKRIPSLQLKDTRCLEMCAGPNCGKQKELAAYAETLCKGKAELKFVPCMRMCGKGPNVRWNGTVYHRATKELLQELLFTDGKV